MMDHVSFDRLSAYADNTPLSVADKTSIERHLAGCASCRDELARIRKMLQMLSSLKGLGPVDSDRFVRNTMRRISDGGHVVHRVSKSRAVRSAATAAVAASVVIAGTIFATMGGFFNTTGPTTVARNEDPRAVTVPVSYAHNRISRAMNVFRSDVEKDATVSLLERHRAKIIAVTDSYVEGRVSASEFNRMLNTFYHLGGRRPYMVSSDMDGFKTVRFLVGEPAQREPQTSVPAMPESDIHVLVNFHR
ncbi:MAG TPA: zf-HC2 domain-containing protein [Spirochaetota bacterium]|nr:zf-HC2 domain-containing protein [Spirochaetota bacterium]